MKRYCDECMKRVTPVLTEKGEYVCPNCNGLFDNYSIEADDYPVDIKLSEGKYDTDNSL